MGGSALGVEERLQEGKQRRLAGVVRIQAAGAGDLVQPEARGRRRAGVLGDRVGVAAALGDGQGDALGVGRGRTPPRSSARILAKPRIAAGEPARTPTNFETEPPAV